MIQSFSWEPNELFFFDKDKKKQQWQKRQKKPLDSLPITLLRDTRISVTFAGDKLGSSYKGKGEGSVIKERAETGDAGRVNSGEQEQRLRIPKKRSDGRWTDFDYEEEEDTQRFLFEEAKFSAPSLLAQIEKFLILLLKNKSRQKEELDELNEEIEAVYGTEWGHGYHGEENNFLEIPDDLFNKLCYDFEQLAEGTIYYVRKWQTNVYRELAALQELKSSHNLIEFQSVASSPEIGLVKSSEKQKVPLDEREKKSDSNKVIITSSSHESKMVDIDREATPVTNISRESKQNVTISKAKTRSEKFKTIPDKERADDKEKIAKAIIPKINIAPNNNFEEETPANVEKTAASNQQQNFLPGSIINFSMMSKSCHDQGWIISKSKVESMEEKNILEWVTNRLHQAVKQKEEEVAKAMSLNENGPLTQRYYGDSKREATFKYKQGVSWAKFVSQKKTEQPSKLFLTALPDGSTCCFYPSGRVAVLCVKCKAGNQSFYTFAYSDEPNSRMLASFTPLGKGCCNHSEKIIKFLVTKKEASFHDQNGILTKKWKWAYGKMMNPEVINLNASISIRCVSQSSIVMNVSINGEVARFPVSPFADAPDQDVENLGYLMTNESFSSRGAAQVQPPRKKLTREEKRAKKRENTKNSSTGISEDSLAERLRDLEEKFPERKDIDFDAPYLLDLQKIQRKVRNIVFDWMEHYRSAIGLARPSKLSLLKKKRMKSANSLPESMPSFVNRLGSPLPRAPSAPPERKSSSRSNLNAKELEVKSSFIGRQSGNRSPNSGSISDLEQVQNETTLEVPQFVKRGGSARLRVPSSQILQKLQSIDSPRQKTPRSLLLPKEGCPVAIHQEILGAKDVQCRCDKRRMPFITDTEYDVFVRVHVPTTQLLVISVISTRLPRTLCDDMLDDLYYEKNKARTVLCSQSRFDPFRLIRYDLATAAQNDVTPLLLRRHNVAPGMFLMYSGGKLLFADYIFNGYGNAKRDLMNQIMKTRKDSMAGTGLAEDFRFNTLRAGREPRTAWGSETRSFLPLGHLPDAIPSSNRDDKKNFTGFPTLRGTKSSKFPVKEQDRRNKQTSLRTYNKISNMHY